MMYYFIRSNSFISFVLFGIKYISYSFCVHFFAEISITMNIE